MRETTLAVYLPASCVQPEPQPEVCPEDAGLRVLISQARSGDMAAFEQLMRRYERLVLMTAVRFLNGNVADAQDAAQTVFLRLHRSLAQFRSDASFSAWLYRITVNVCHDMNRRSQRRAEVELSSVARTLPAAADNAAADDERRLDAVKAGLSRLGEKERAAIVLRDIEGLDTAQVASILGSSEATIRSQISVGRRKLRKFAEAYLRRQP
ncbi:MAG TPA: sigma-70 family RNA polymerase sigma factor [Bryobacteraceae bacterium]|nr:sigma-70 family RNA polymerase sigma factor [Bryobacteraceae bacterium]